MKKTILVLAAAFFMLSAAEAQGIKGLFNKITKKDTTTTGTTNKTSILDKIKSTTSGSGATGNGLSTDQIVAGLKEALRVGTDSTAKKLGAANGFFANAAIKILMPPEAKKVESKLRSLGMGKLVDNAILSMNRAAEDAASGVGTIFWNSIKSMSVSDGLGILRGGDFAATDYLKKTTTTQLTEQFRPVIEASLKKVNATQYWSTVFNTYNKFSATKVNTDLTAYVTERALSGLFYNVGLEEQKIRKDPAARVTDLLKNVFGK